MSWKQRFTYRTKHFVERTVGESKVRFYPNRIGLLPDLADISGPVAKSLSVLFGGDSRADAGVVTKRFQEGAAHVEETRVEPIAAELATLRATQRETAIEALLESIRSPRNRICLGRLLMDSMRDEFPYAKERSARDVEEFLDGDGEDYPGLDVRDLTEIIGGWIAANAKVFGDAGERVAALAKERLGGLRSDSSPETPPTTGGSGSKKQSSPQSEPASASTS